MARDRPHDLSPGRRPIVATMDSMRAVCESCGRVFPLGMSWAAWAHGMPEPPQRQCPHCGGWGIAQGSVYEVAGTAVQVMTASGMSEVELKGVMDVLVRAQALDATPEDVVAEVERASPPLGGLLRLLVPLGATACTGPTATA